MVSVYSAAHFLVDFACAFLIFRGIGGSPDRYLCILLYNFCAFAMQMPIGILADKLNKNYLFAAAGCVLVGAAYGFLRVPAAAAVIVGIGNGMFHVGGGIDVLNISGQKCGALGVFVSPGAFGVYFGTMLGRGQNGLSAVHILVALLAAAALIFIMDNARGKSKPDNAEFSLGGGASKHIPAAVACLFLVVCLRSYIGLTTDFPWKSGGYFAVVLVCAVVFGKTAGGFAADRFGLIRTSCVSLGIAALLSLMPQIPAAGIMSILLFNMTMPVTLWLAAKIFPNAKGFAFGMLTFGLFLGFLPVHMGVGFSSPWLFAAAAAVSLGLLSAGIRKAGL